MAQYGNISGGGGFAGFSPQEQALSYGQQRYMRGRPSLSQQAELMGGYAVPLYAAQEQKKEQKSYMDIQRAWYDKQAEMFTNQINEYKKQAELGRISEQEMFTKTSALEKQLADKRMQMERGIAEQQLKQQKTQGYIGMGLQAAQTGMQAYQVGKAANWWGSGATASTAAAGAAGTGVAAGGVYGSGSLGYGGVALGSSGAGAGPVAAGAGPVAAGAGGAGATASVAGPLAGAVTLKYTHQPIEWGLNKITGGWWSGGKEYTPEEWAAYVNWIQSGGRAARDAVAPLMAYTAGPARRESDYLKASAGNFSSDATVIEAIRKLSTAPSVNYPSAQAGQAAGLGYLNASNAELWARRARTT